MAKCHLAVNSVAASTGADPELLHPMALDVASAESLSHFVDDFQVKFHRLDVLVNNAGVFVRRPVPVIRPRSQTADIDGTAAQRVV